MKKPSISTTVDQQSTLPPTPYSKKSHKPWPSLVSPDHLQLPLYHNYLYTTIGLAYIIQCVYDPQQLHILLQKLNSKQISLLKCRNIPHNFKDIYEQKKLIEKLGKVIEFVRERIYEHRDHKFQLEEIIGFVSGEPGVAFALVVMIRSIALFQVEELVEGRRVDFMGNEKEVLADYAVNPEYRAVEVLSKIFNYSIKVVNKNWIEVGRRVVRSNPTGQVMVEKVDKRIFVNVILNKQPIIKKGYQSSYDILKPQDKDLRLHIEQPKQQEPLIQYPDSRLKQKQRDLQKDKQREKDKSIESVNVSKHQLPTDRVKICLSCGQQRKPDQKFCECKKRKVTTTKTIL